MDAKNDAGSFGFQWKFQAPTQLDDVTSHRSENAFRSSTSFLPEELAGQPGLDVACGMGRFPEVARPWSSHVVGLDLTLTSQVAARNLAEPERLHLSGLYVSTALCHREPRFHLQHWSAAPHSELRAGSQSSAQAAEAGRSQRMAVQRPWYRMSDLYRKVTRRMSPKMLHKLCYAVIPRHGAHQVLGKIPLVGKPTSGALTWLISMSFNIDATWRVPGTFDRYSPWYQSKHTYEEAFRWFESCGLEDFRVIEQPIAVRGRRPLLCESFPMLEAEEVLRCAE
jgi:hypothetical protein